MGAQIVEKNTVIWGVQQVFIRPGDGFEYQAEVTQECQIKATAQIAKLMGDDSLVPLDTQAKSKDISISLKNGKFSALLAQLLMGGATVSLAPESMNPVSQESVGDCMALGLVPTITDPTQLTTDTFTFIGIDANDYNVIRSSDGQSLGIFQVSPYPNTTLIPGISFICNPTKLCAGDAASFTTVGANDTVQIGDEGKNDFAGKVGVRCITEPPSESQGQVSGQWEFLFPVCQSEGLEFPVKTKDYCIISGSFIPLYDPSIGKIMWLRKYSRGNGAC